MKKILYHLHIMWYETDLVNETLDSLLLAINSTKNATVDIKICYNYQTYLEIPDVTDVKKLFDKVNLHPIFNNSLIDIKISEKTMHDNFYNIADWRRDNYGDDYDYYVWGESDCLVPACFFTNISRIDYLNPHVVSYSQRKMWDESWLEVEHELLKPIPYDYNMELIKPLGQHYYMSIEEMNNFNSIFPINVVSLKNVKIDGNMTALSKGLPTPIIPIEMHFIHEDLALQLLLQKNNICQLHFPYQIKVHNRMHPLKRVYTKTKKETNLYLKYQQESLNCLQKI
jgi:hypothetical protein